MESISRLSGLGRQTKNRFKLLWKYSADEKINGTLNSPYCEIKGSSQKEIPAEPEFYFLFESKSEWRESHGGLEIEAEIGRAQTTSEEMLVAESSATIRIELSK